MSLLTDFLMIMGAIVTFLFMLMGIVNWLSRGFWSTWLRVRMSRGRRWLIRVWTPTSPYYTHGIPDGEVIRYKDKKKQGRTVNTGEGTAYRSFGVDCIETDETTNGVRYTENGEPVPADAVRVKGAFHVIPGFDAVTFDTLLQRAYELGRLAKQSKEKIILFLIVIIALILVFVLYLQYTQAQQVSEILNVVTRGPTV